MLPEIVLPRLNYVETGKGKITLVFLHYFGGSSNSWSGVINVLKNNFTCIAIDFRGFGNSPAPEKQLSVRDNAKDVLDLIQALKLKKYVLIGHSMGGKIALSVASEKPLGLASLILIAPSPPTPERTNNKARKILMDVFGDRIAIEKLIIKITSKLLTDLAFEETVKDHLQVSKIAWNAWIEKGSQENISSVIKNSVVPVFVISGASDANFSTNFLRKEFVKYFPTAKFKELSDVGHLLPVEVPLEVAKLIQEYILNKATYVLISY